MEEKESFLTRLKHGWNAFSKEGKYDGETASAASGYSSSIGTHTKYRPAYNDKSMVTALYNRIALDVSSMYIHHVRVDDEGKFREIIRSPLNSRLTLDPNLDQTRVSFFQDIVLSLFDEGAVAIVPTHTSMDPNKTGSYTIDALRVGKITQWYPKKVKVRVYNEDTGQFSEIIIDKSVAAIIENPLYEVVNKPNSTVRRLTRKLAILDAIDEQSGSGKLDMIIQLPYVIKTDKRRAEAERRRKDIEVQLNTSKYGVAYIDGTEKVTQLNRPLENNILKQIEFLTSMLYNQLGITENVFNGTASEAEMLNYYSRIIEPILHVIVDGMRRTFLTKTARSQKQDLMFFRDPFKLVPVTVLAEIADKFTRNEILASNEIRGILGYKPSDDPKADQLVNSNLNSPEPYPEEYIEEEEYIQDEEETV